MESDTANEEVMMRVSRVFLGTLVAALVTTMFRPALVFHPLRSNFYYRCADCARVRCLVC